MAEDREVVVYARLGDPEPPEPQNKDLKRYSFYAAMRVQENLDKVRRTLLDYSVYPKMISYVDQADYSAANHLLTVEGGIWKFRLRSTVLMEERSERWLHFRIVGGHFPGLVGDVFFEPMPAGQKGTLVYFRGERSAPAQEWPPRFVIERGAEIVFGFTGARMRSYIESTPSQKTEKGPSHHDREVPQPRSRF